MRMGSSSFSSSVGIAQLALIAMLIGAASSASESQPAALNANVAVDFQSSKGPRFPVERVNNLSRARTFPEQRDADIQFYNEQGLHGHIYRVWVDTQLIHDPATGTYNYEGINDYLADVSRLADNLLVVMDTRVQVRDHKQSPAQIKPIVKTITRELKQRFPHIRYIEAFNEPDHNLAQVLKPEGLYDFYRVYYEAVNEINRELRPRVPLEVGGPAFMMYNEAWLRAFLDSYKADPSSDKRLDFISYHAYGAFPPGGGDKQGPRAFHFFKGDPSEVADQRTRLEAELRSRGLDVNTPSFITELGIYPGPSFDNQKDARPDYLIQAAGVPSLLYWFMEQPRVVPFNWVLRHFSEERKDQLLTRAGEGKAVPTGIFTPYGNAMLMMSKLKDERVTARSDTLTKGKGIYAIATKDETGAAVMLWNYQHTDTQPYRVTIKMGQLPASLRKKSLRQRMYRIDDRTSNYWGDPARANLQQISETPIKAGSEHSVTIDLSANALQLLVLEPIAAPARTAQ
jgi:hypothetical protein